jgi:hypothetical protein
MRVLAVRAGLGRRHPLAVEAEKGVLEEQRGYAQFVFVELLEDVLGIIGAVVAAHACVVAANYEVSAAVVLAGYGVEDRLARPRVAHRSREDRQDRPVPRVVAVQDDLVALHPHRRRDVV